MTAYKQCSQGTILRGPNVSVPTDQQGVVNGGVVYAHWCNYQPGTGATSDPNGTGQPSGNTAPASPSNPSSLVGFQSDMQGFVDTVTQFNATNPSDQPQTIRIRMYGGQYAPVWRLNKGGRPVTTVNDAVSVHNSFVITSASTSFNAATDVGTWLTGGNIPTTLVIGGSATNVYAYIAAVNSLHSITYALAPNENSNQGTGATATGINLPLTFGGGAGPIMGSSPTSSLGPAMVDRWWSQGMTDWANYVNACASTTLWTDFNHSGSKIPLDQHPSFVDAEGSGCMLFFPETFIRFAPQSALFAAGCTTPLDLAALKGNVDALNAAFTYTPVMLDCNKYQNLDNLAPQGMGMLQVLTDYIVDNCPGVQLTNASTTAVGTDSAIYEGSGLKDGSGTTGGYPSGDNYPGLFNYGPGGSFGTQKASKTAGGNQRNKSCALSSQIDPNASHSDQAAILAWFASLGLTSAEILGGSALTEISAGNTLLLANVPSTPNWPFRTFITDPYPPLRRKSAYLAY